MYTSKLLLQFWAMTATCLLTVAYRGVVAEDLDLSDGCGSSGAGALMP